MAVRIYRIHTYSKETVGSNDEVVCRVRVKNDYVNDTVTDLNITTSRAMMFSSFTHVN